MGACVHAFIQCVCVDISVFKLIKLPVFNVSFRARKDKNVPFHNDLFFFGGGILNSSNALCASIALAILNVLLYYRTCITH